MRQPFGNALRNEGDGAGGHALSGTRGYAQYLTQIDAWHPFKFEVGQALCVNT
jgi:hypothetical protein